ncbi:MAG: tRNA threonylcarbamoyladenosine dehydratase [Nitrosopumilaceae archaeon]
MEEYWLSRTELLLGREKLALLKEKHVLVVGLGGVGSFAAEMIARAGIGKMTIVDSDIVNPSNINRQLPALNSTIGEKKAQIMTRRLKDINSNIELKLVDVYVREESIAQLINEHYDYVVDAIDTLTPKMFLIHRCLQEGLKIVSSMGAGGRMDPTKIHIDLLENSFNCSLAQKLRKRLGKLGVSKKFPVVFSSEKVDKNLMVPVEELNKKNIVGTISYLPAIFGMFCASVVIRDLIGEYEL